MKFFAEIVKDSGTYYANIRVQEKPGELDKIVCGLPEYVDYKTLKAAVKAKTGIELLKAKDLYFNRFGHKLYAYIDATQPRTDCRVSLYEILHGWKPKFD